MQTIARTARGTGTATICGAEGYDTVCTPAADSGVIPGSCSDNRPGAVRLVRLVAGLEISRVEGTAAPGIGPLTGALEGRAAPAAALTATATALAPGSEPPGTGVDPAADADSGGAIMIGAGLRGIVGFRFGTKWMVTWEI